MEAITDLLTRWRQGDRAAESMLIEALYPSLRQIAAAQMRRAGVRSLQPTELAHEAYERLQLQHGVDWRNRQHFMAIAATVIRRVWIDYLRQRSAEKRGGAEIMLSLQDVSNSEQPSSGDGVDWLALDQALEDLARAEPEVARVVELRLYSGLEVQEIAQLCASSVATVGRQWRFARAWIADRIGMPWKDAP